MFRSICTDVKSICMYLGLICISSAESPGVLRPLLALQGLLNRAYLNSPLSNRTYLNGPLSNWAYSNPSNRICTDMKFIRMYLKFIYIYLELIYMHGYNELLPRSPVTQDPALSLRFSRSKVLCCPRECTSIN